MSSLISAPDFLDPMATNAWERIQRRAKVMGMWEPQFLIGLELVASVCARYLESARKVRGDAHVSPDVLDEIEQFRAIARGMLVDWQVIPKDRQHLALFNDEGLDADIAAVCVPIGNDGSIASALGVVDFCGANEQRLFPV